MTIPSLPTSGALRVLVIAATLSLFLMLYSFVRDLRTRSGKRVWFSGATFFVAIFTIFAARRVPTLHPVLSLAVLFGLVYQATRTPRTHNGAQILAAVTWAISLVCARILF